MQKKTKRVDGFREGNIWLNILETQDGTELFTLNKSFKTKEGWRYSNFFQHDAGDADCIALILERWEQRRRADRAQVSIGSDDADTPPPPAEAVE